MNHKQGHGLVHCRSDSQEVPGLNTNVSWGPRVRRSPWGLWGAPACLQLRPGWGWGTQSRQILGACAESVTPQGPDPHPGSVRRGRKMRGPAVLQRTWCNWVRCWAISRPGRPEETLACRLYLWWAQATCCRPVYSQKREPHLIGHPAQASCPSLYKIFHEWWALYEILHDPIQSKRSHF